MINILKIDTKRIEYLINKSREFHRKDGTTVEYNNGNKYWYFKGLLHREDGPAVEYGNGDKEWYINGERFTEEEFNKKTKG